MYKTKEEDTNAFKYTVASDKKLKIQIYSTDNQRSCVIHLYNNCMTVTGWLGRDEQGAFKISIYSSRTGKYLPNYGSHTKLGGGSIAKNEAMRKILLKRHEQLNPWTRLSREQVGKTVNELEAYLLGDMIIKQQNIYFKLQKIIDACQRTK